MKQKPTPATDLELLVLDHARRGLGPGAARRRLTLDRLATTFAALPSATLAERILSEPAPPDPPIAPEPPGASTTGAGGGLGAAASLGRFSLHTLVAGVLAGAVVGFGAGVLAGSADPPSATAPGVATGSAPAPHAPATTPHVETPPVDALPPAALAPPASAVKKQSARPRPSAEHRAALSPPSASSGAVAATFYEELSYVRRAQSALQQGNATLALGLMQSLDEIQSSGALVAERSMTRVLALCQLDRSAEATEVARGMLSSDRTADVYRRRLAGSCAGAGLPGAVEQQSPVKDPEE